LGIEGLYKLFHPVARSPLIEPAYLTVLKRFSWIEQVLQSVGYPYSYEVFFLSRAALSSLIGLAASVTIAAILFLLRVPTLVCLVAGLASGVVAGNLAFNLAVVALYIKRSMARSSINSYLPYTLMVMSLYGAGGYQPLAVIAKAQKLVAEKNSKAALARILASIESGESIEDSILREALYSPSPDFGSFLEGLASVATSGVQTMEYLTSSLDNYLKRLDSKFRDKIDKLAVIMEVYIASGILLPFMVQIILLFFGGQIALPIPPMALLLLLFFIVIPLAFLATLLIVDSALSEVRL